MSAEVESARDRKIFIALFVGILLALWVMGPGMVWLAEWSVRVHDGPIAAPPPPWWLCVMSWLVVFIMFRENGNVICRWLASIERSKMLELREQQLVSFIRLHGLTPPGRIPKSAESMPLCP